MILNPKETDILLNPAQLMIELSIQRIKMLQMGRGGGKSFAAAIEIKNVINDMPKSKNFIVTGTFQQALTMTLPSTVKALQILGLVKNLHFFVGRYPPKAWKWAEC